MSLRPPVKVIITYESLNLQSIGQYHWIQPDPYKLQLLHIHALLWCRWLMANHPNLFQDFPDCTVTWCQQWLLYHSCSLRVWQYHRSHPQPMHLNIMHMYSHGSYLACLHIYTVFTVGPHLSRPQRLRIPMQSTKYMILKPCHLHSWMGLKFIIAYIASLLGS